jgi:hypothetical protein
MKSRSTKVGRWSGSQFAPVDFPFFLGVFRNLNRREHPASCCRPSTSLRLCGRCTSQEGGKDVRILVYAESDINQIILTGALSGFYKMEHFSFFVGFSHKSLVVTPNSQLAQGFSDFIEPSAERILMPALVNFELIFSSSVLSRVANSIHSS